MPLTVIDQLPPVAVPLPRSVAPSRSWTAVPASAVPTKVTLAVASSALSAGAVKAGASGAAVSTMKVCAAGVGSALPAWSVAVTVKVWVPSASVAVVNGDVQVLAVPLSTLHENVAPASLLKLKAGLLSLVGDAIGVRVVSGGAVSTMNVCEAGVGSTLPAASVARTWNVWLPSLSAAVVSGDVQSANVAPSSEHCSVEPDSVELNANVGVLSFVGELIMVSDVSGATVSTVQVCVAGLGSMLPAASTASTRKVCEPWLRVLKVIGVVQDVKSCVSIWQRKVAPASELNANVAEVDRVGPLGPLLIVVSGGVRSIVHVYDAGVPSTLPAASIASTANVCEPATSPG